MITALTATMLIHILRLHPGDDVKKSLEAFVHQKNLKAAVIVTAVGSLTEANLRYANQPKASTIKGHFEVVSLTGTLGSTSVSHLHISVSDGSGKTFGGHLMDGSKVYTTLELAVGEVQGKEFKRTLDKTYGYEELNVD